MTLYWLSADVPRCRACSNTLSTPFVFPVAAARDSFTCTPPSPPPQVPWPQHPSMCHPPRLFRSMMPTPVCSSSLGRYGTGGGGVNEAPVTMCMSFQGDTRVYIYEILSESPYFLECSSFSSTEPHKVPSPLLDPLLHAQRAVGAKGASA